MACADKKYPTNIAGRIFVDKECIDCDLCRVEVPEVFTRHDDGYSYVYSQPTSEEILQRTKDMIYNCPVEAIGDSEA